MAFSAAVRVFETTTTTGTGTLSLAGAETGFRTFVAGHGTGNAAYFMIEDANGVGWEFSLGTVTDGSPDTLTRAVLKSSNSDALLNLSAGSHKVYSIDHPAFAATDMDFNDLLLKRPRLQDWAERISSASISGGVLTLDYTQGNHFEVAHNMNITSLVINNPPASGSVGTLTLWLTQDATGGRTLSVSSAFRPDGGSAPSLLPVPNAINMLKFWTKDAGTKWQYKLNYKGT